MILMRFYRSLIDFRIQKITIWFKVILVFPAVISYRPLDKLNVDHVWNLIFRITQSNEDFKINKSFRITVFVLYGIEVPA